MSKCNALNFHLHHMKTRDQNDRVSFEITQHAFDCKGIWYGSGYSLCLPLQLCYAPCPLQRYRETVSRGHACRVLPVDWQSTLYFYNRLLSLGFRNVLQNKNDMVNHG